MTGLIICKNMALALLKENTDGDKIVFHSVENDKDLHIIVSNDNDLQIFVEIKLNESECINLIKYLEDHLKL